jgi:hypothetical protein
MGASFAGMLAGGQKVGLFQTHIPPPGLSIPCFVHLFVSCFLRHQAAKEAIKLYNSYSIVEGEVTSGKVIV